MAYIKDTIGHGVVTKPGAYCYCLLKLQGFLQLCVCATTIPWPDLAKWFLLFLSSEEGHMSFVYVCIIMHVCMYTCVCVCVCVCVPVCVCVCIFVCVHAYK